MSRKGNCWDSAPMESFCGALKSELVHHRRFSTREQARREIDEYLEIVYNRIRQQARLGYLSLLLPSTRNAMQKDSRVIRCSLWLPPTWLYPKASETMQQA